MPTPGSEGNGISNVPCVTVSWVCQLSNVHSHHLFYSVLLTHLPALSIPWIPRFGQREIRVPVPVSQGQLTAWLPSGELTNAAWEWQAFPNGNSKANGIQVNRWVVCPEIISDRQNYQWKKPKAVSGVGIAEGKEHQSHRIQRPGGKCPQRRSFSDKGWEAAGLSISRALESSPCGKPLRRLQDLTPHNKTQLDPKQV